MMLPRGGGGGGDLVGTLVVTDTGSVLVCTHCIGPWGQLLLPSPESYKV